MRDDVSNADLVVRVVTHGGLLPSGRSGATDATFCVDPGKTLADVLTSLGIDLGMVGVAAIDGTIVQLNAVLQSGVVVHVYPMFGGG